MPKGATYFVQPTAVGWSLNVEGRTINRYATRAQALADGSLVAALLDGLLVEGGETDQLVRVDGLHDPASTLEPDTEGTQTYSVDNRIRRSSL